MGTCGNNYCPLVPRNIGAFGWIEEIDHRDAESEKALSILMKLWKKDHPGR